MLLFVIDAAILGLETVPAVMAQYGTILLGSDSIILGVFVVEILVRVFAHRLAFFRDPWTLFDFTVVAIAPVSTAIRALRLRAKRFSCSHLSGTPQSRQIL